MQHNQNIYSCCVYALFLLLHRRLFRFYFCFCFLSHIAFFAHFSVFIFVIYVLCVCVRVCLQSKQTPLIFNRLNNFQYISIDTHKIYEYVTLFWFHRYIRIIIYYLRENCMHTRKQARTTAEYYIGVSISFYRRSINSIITQYKCKMSDLPE